jgi:biopolymer transport protein ExbB
MIGLIFASVLTWTTWLAKTLELIGARRSLARAQGVLAEAARPAGVACRPVARLIAAVESELRRSPDRRDTDGIKERIAARFDARRHHREIGGMQLRDPDEAVNDAPHRAEQADEGRGRTDGGEDAGAAQHLPADERIEAGAEALLATAFGLAAAIPAVVIYNMFSRSIAQYRALYADASVEILTMVSRDLVQRPERYPAAVPAAE